MTFKRKNRVIDQYKEEIPNGLMSSQLPALEFQTNGVV